MGLFNKKKKKEDASDKALGKSETKKDVAKKADSKLKVEHKKSASDRSSKNKAKKSGQAHRFLLKPIISEKATIGASDNQYTFQVSIDANKVAISKSIEEVYGVVPKSVNIINKRGKNVRFGRKFGRTKNFKKAIVTLKKGDTIKLYEGI